MELNSLHALQEFRLILEIIGQLKNLQAHIIFNTESLDESAGLPTLLTIVI